MNNEDYVTYNQAQALKKAGFDYPCYFYYTKEDAPDGCVWHTTSEEAPIDYNRSVYAGCSMPTLAQAQKWLRENKETTVVIYPQIIDSPVEYSLGDEWHYSVWVGRDIYEASDTKDKYFDTYESALSAGITAALKLINHNQTA